MSKIMEQAQSLYGADVVKDVENVKFLYKAIIVTRSIFMGLKDLVFFLVGSLIAINYGLNVPLSVMLGIGIIGSVTLTLYYYFGSRKEVLRW